MLIRIKILIVLFMILNSTRALALENGDNLMLPSDKDVFYLELKNHIFTPNQLTIPSDRKIKLVIQNKDSVAEEFDSFDLNREKMIFPGKKAIIFIGPLEPGIYHYFGEYNPDTARGIVIVKGSPSVN